MSEVRAFLEWLDGEGYVIAHVDHDGTLMPNGNNRDQWLRAFSTSRPAPEDDFGDTSIHRAMLAARAAAEARGETWAPPGPGESRLRR